MPDGLEDCDAARHLVSTPKSEGFFVGGALGDMWSNHAAI